MSKLPKKFETITNVAVIVVFFVLVGRFIYQTYENKQSQAPTVGSELPQLTGYQWQSSPHSLLLVLRKGCHFCEESMPFYRTLWGLEKNNRLSAKMVAVFPDRAEEANELLRQENLPIPDVPQFDLSSLKVSGTPTLILADKAGKVERTWVGKLDSPGENSVLSALRKDQPETATDPHP